MINVPCQSTPQEVHEGGFIMKIVLKYKLLYIWSQIVNVENQITTAKHTLMVIILYPSNRWDRLLEMYFYFYSDSPDLFQNIFLIYCKQWESSHTLLSLFYQTHSSPWFWTIAVSLLITTRLYNQGNTCSLYVYLVVYPLNCHSPTQLNSTQVGGTTFLLSYPPHPPPHHKLLRHFQAKK